MLECWEVLLTVGSKVLNPDPTLKDIIENSEIVQAQIQAGFDDISDKLGSIQIQLEDLRKIAQKMLNLAELKFVEGLKRVEAYWKNVYRNKTLL